MEQGNCQNRFPWMEIHILMSNELNETARFIRDFNPPPLHYLKLLLWNNIDAQNPCTEQLLLLVILNHCFLRSYCIFYLKVCFAHGGGAFPFTIGRIEHGFNVRPDLCAVSCKVNPRQYLGRVFTDSLVHDDNALDLLLQTIGEVCI